MELQVEILKKHNNIVRSNSYIGGNIHIGEKKSSVVHIGIVGEQMDVIVDELIKKAGVVIKWK